MGPAKERMLRRLPVTALFAGCSAEVTGRAARIEKQMRVR